MEDGLGGWAWVEVGRSMKTTVTVQMIVAWTRIVAVELVEVNRSEKYLGNKMNKNW